MMFSKILKLNNKDDRKKKQIEKIRDKLTKEKESLENELKKLVDLERQDLLPEFGDDRDEDIQADQVEELGNVFALRQVLENDLKSVIASLEKIKSGDFGVCEKCHSPIKYRRLKIRPSAKYCMKCVKSMEGR